MVRIAVAVIALFCCLGAAYLAGSAGLSTLNSEEGLDSGSLPAADRAVNLSPSDPDAHYARAIALTFNGEPPEKVIGEYERAASLRPRDHYLWLTIGAARDQMGNEEGAVEAFREAVRLAPFYAEPRWQLGNVLLRAGRMDESIRELRLAALSNPALLPGFIDLAWGASGGDARVATQLVNPETDEWRLALARFLVKRGKTPEALTLFRAAGGASEKDRADLLQELLSAKRFNEAYEVWAMGEGGRRPTNGMTDPGFEEQIKLNSPGFGWQVSRDLKPVKVSVDKSEPRQGASSLRLDWAGDAPPATAVVSQIVLVEPNSRYKLRFAARSEKLVTGGLPVIIVADAGGKDPRELAQSDPLPQEAGDWREYELEFVTGGDTSAVTVALRRQNCASGPCPVFGRLWLDDFSLRKL
jgi:hypothetical protein